METLVREWISQNKINTWEGRTGLKNLSKLLFDMGYGDTSANFGLPIQDFLSDNPQVIENIVEWICKQENDEWSMCLESTLD